MGIVKITTGKLERILIPTGRNTESGKREYVATILYKELSKREDWLISGIQHIEHRLFPYAKVEF